MRVIYNPPYTITYFSDNTKVIVKATNEPFSEEIGLAMCVVKKFVPNRTEFLRLVKNAQRVLSKDDKEN